MQLPRLLRNTCLTRPQLPLPRRAQLFDVVDMRLQLRNSGGLVVYVCHVLILLTHQLPKGVFRCADTGLG